MNSLLARLLPGLAPLESAPSVQLERAPSRNRPVAYFCAEFALDDTLPIYSGGLGALAGDVIIEAAEERYPLIGIGLFYAHGYFTQDIGPDGQIEIPLTINPTEAGLTLVTDEKDTLLIPVPIEKRIVLVQAWLYKRGTVSVYLLDTNHWRNSESDRLITDRLYSGDAHHRLTQQLVLAVAGFRLLEALGITPHCYHMNEGHAALLSLELIRFFKGDLAKAKQKLVFTNHTLVPAGNDVYDNQLVQELLESYRTEYPLSLNQILQLGVVPNAPHRFSMTHLAMRTARVSSAVSKLHATKAQTLWPSNPLLPITNGVAASRWMAPEIALVIETEHPRWKTDLSPLGWKRIRRADPTTLWEVHQTLKTRMLEQVFVRTGIQLDPAILTVVWARRFASYKRPDLIVSDLATLRGLLFDAKQPFQVIIAGKAHPADTYGKVLLESVEELASAETGHRVVFVEDYSLTLAQHLVQGADVWLNTPIYGLEASGTSGMKASLNGALNYTVADGWAAEVPWKHLGFELPASRTEEAIYRILKRSILPLYYKRDQSGLPRDWVALMLRSIEFIAPRYCAARMLHAYDTQLYRLPRPGKILRP